MNCNVDDTITTLIRISGRYRWRQSAINEVSVPHHQLLLGMSRQDRLAELRRRIKALETPDSDRTTAARDRELRRLRKEYEYVRRGYL